MTSFPRQEKPRRVFWESIGLAIKSHSIAFAPARVSATATLKKVCAKLMRSMAWPFPESVVLDEFDEFQGDVVLEKSLVHLVETNSQIRDLDAAVKSANSPPQRRRNFQKLFDTVVTMWVNGELVVDGVESWDAFIARVNRGLSQFLSTASKSETCAIFTSGGPVAVSVQRALRLSPQDTLASCLDAAQLFVQRIFIFCGSFHAQHFQLVSAFGRSCVADLQVERRALQIWPA